MSSDRSTLEGKDRAELTVIAEAMGAKVGSRMRKAQIIDLIVGQDAEGQDDSANATDRAGAKSSRSKAKAKDQDDADESSEEAADDSGAGDEEPSDASGGSDGEDRGSESSAGE